MEALALYLFRSSVWLTGFALVYALFLRNERFFNLNRIYLVSGILVSFIFPLFTWHYTVLLPLVPVVEGSEPQIQGIVVPEQSFNPQNLLLVGYLAGILFLVFRILKQTLPIFSIIKKSETYSYRSAKLIRTDAYPASFSFFSFIFVNPSIDEIETNEIVNHELEHIRQQHWIDLLLFEILRTMQWFNPVIWLYGHLIRQNHEYLADEHALQRSANPAIYRAALLNQMFGGPVISLANSFNYSLNKKRFNMMKHNIKSPLRKLKLLLVLPLMAGVFYAFATPEYKFQQAKENSVQDEGLTIQDAKTFSNGQNKDQASLKDSVTTLKGNFVSLSSKGTASVSGLNFNAKNVQGKSKNGTNIIKADTISVDFAKSNSLFIIDGKEATKAEVDQLNPDKIESVNVLKGESATTKYGIKGKNGVIEITLNNIIGTAFTKNNTDSANKAVIKNLFIRKTSGHPLVVRDGIILGNKDLTDFNISIENFESYNVNILKGESATNKYGEKGKDGVIEITSKKVARKEEDAKSTLPPTIYLQTNSPLKFGISDDSGKQPLIVKDGVIVEGMNVNNIPPETIESINVLKGEQATKIYGNKGINGVILITSKKGTSNTSNSTIDVKLTADVNDKKANTSDQLNSNVQILSTVTSGTEPKPLIVIDGRIAENQNMKDIDPETIKSVNVLKGESAINKYGDKGKNGVVEITLKQIDDSAVYVEALPEFSGGIEALKQFVASSMEYPALALKNGIHGQVMVGFVVSKTGEIINVKVKSGVDPSLDKEAMRIVKSMPKWIPGKQRGQSIRVPYQLPINFSLPADKTNKSKLK